MAYVSKKQEKMALRERINQEIKAVRQAVNMLESEGNQKAIKIIEVMLKEMGSPIEIAYNMMSELPLVQERGLPGYMNPAREAYWSM